MELKLKGIALNRSRNHTEDKENRQRSLGKDFYGQSVRIFKLKKESFFFPIQILIISLLRDDQRSHGPITHIAWGTCGFRTVH